MSISTKIADLIRKMRIAYPETAKLTDDEIVARLVPAAKIAKSNGVSDADVEAVLSQLVSPTPGMMREPAWLEAFAAAIHRRAQEQKEREARERAGLDAAIGTPHEASASGNVTKTTTASAPAETPVERARRLAGINSPAEAPAKTEHMSRRVAKANAPRPASELLEHRAAMLKAERASAGTTISSAQAYSAVLTDPKHAALAKQVREEEQAAAGVRH